MNRQSTVGLHLQEAAKLLSARSQQPGWKAERQDVCTHKDTLHLNEQQQ